MKGRIVCGAVAWFLIAWHSVVVGDDRGQAIAHGVSRK